MNFYSTHTKPGHSKANTTLSVSDYTKLLQIAAEARKLIGTKYDRLTVGRYRVFTEPRKGGLRTKLWGSGTIQPQQVKDIQDLLTKRFPQYAIRVEYNATKQCRWYLDALSIFITMKPVIADPKPAVVEEKPKARLAELCGTPLIMRNARVNIATISAGTLYIETQAHICVGFNTKELEIEICDSWLVLDDEMISHKDSDKYENYIELHTGRKFLDIVKDAEIVAGNLIRESIVLHNGKLFVG
jgi:hypothetical protein